MTLGNFFFQGDLQTLVNYDSFEGKVLITKFAELQVLQKSFFSSKKHHTIVRN